MNPGWKLHWYEAVAVIGCGEKYLPLAGLEEALRAVPLDDTSLLTVGAASSREARVTITTRARHSGAAASRLADLLAAAPRGWDWEAAELSAFPRREGIARWPRLAVFPDRGETVSIEAAKWLAGRVLAGGSGDQPGELRELLLECGLTVSAGKETAVPSGEAEPAEPRVSVRHGTPGLPARLESSACCGRPVTVAGRTTNYYVCSACGQPCDIAVS